jgi:uncharacterized membrane protein
MPRESRLFVKTGLLFLALTFVFGAVLLTREALGMPLPPVLGVEHAHLAGVGWLVNTVIGIAIWMLPLNRERFPATAGRYPASAVYASFALLNGGLVLRLLAEPWYQLGGYPAAASGLLLLAAVAQPLGIVVFVWIAWQRVRAPSHPAPGVR